MRKIAHCLLVLFSLAVAAKGGQDLLKVAICECASPPLVMWPEESDYRYLDTGFLRDFYMALGLALGKSLLPVPLPRKRLLPALQSRQVDLMCDAHPQWFPSERLQWSGPVFDNVERLVVPQGRQVDQLTDLLNMRIGALHGFEYPVLDAGFASGQFIRDNTFSNKTNLQKLRAGHVDVIILPQMQFSDLQKRQAWQVDGLHMANFIISRTPTYCALGPKSRLSLGDLNIGLSQLRQSGQLQELLRRYGMETEH